jgi:choice-of-anchor A domain-containing protein
MFVRGLNMSTKKLYQVKRGGFTLAMVLCVVVLLLIIGAGVLSIGTQRRLGGVRAGSEITARSAADSGLTHGLFALNQMLETKTWSDGSLPYETGASVPFSDATFSYYVSRISAADSNDDVYTIQSIGNSGLAQKTVKSTLELKGLFEYAIYVAEDLVLRSGTTISAYNQDTDDPPLQIGTNSTEAGAVTCKSGVTIDGDIVVGPDGDPDVVINNTSEATITGESYASLIKNKTPIISVPQYLQDMASSGSVMDSKTISSSAKYDSLDLFNDPNKGAGITIDGNIELYVTGDIRLGNSDKIEIKPDSSVTIFLGGNLLCDNSGAINNLTQDPKKLKIFGLDTCTSMDFKNTGSFYGAIYAPNADIHLYNGVSVYGSMIGNSFTQDVNANFYYDMELREVDPHEIGVHMVIKRWSER